MVYIVFFIVPFFPLLMLSECDGVVEQNYNCSPHITKLKICIVVQVLFFIQELVLMSRQGAAKYFKNYSNFFSYGGFVAFIFFYVFKL